jgi:hypothetical protein
MKPPSMQRRERERERESEKTNALIMVRIHKDLHTKS